MSSVATSAGSSHEAAHPQDPLPFSTLDGLVPTKTVLLTADPAAADPVAAKREEILAYFHRTCELDDRLFDLIRNEAGIATMTVGNVSSHDQVNTLVASGRADLCVLARPHLADPYWTLHAAAEQGYDPQPHIAAPVAV